MQSKFRAKRMLLAGASLLALMAGAGGASATTFDFTGTVQHFTIVTSGLYDIEAAGAQGGGGGPGFFGFSSGGAGAEVGGEVFLTAGEMLNIVAGGRGATGIYGTGGGGGFSGVFAAAAPLIMAGGGGGGSYGSGNGGPGLASINGGNGNGDSPGQGGANGLGGGAGRINGAGGGSGFQSDGGTASNGGGQGGQGYLGGQYLSPGGFGGGGGSGLFGGGGGGGFSGGGGGGFPGGGGGGGSYVATAFTNTSGTDGANLGNGFVTIDPVTPAVPEASTWAMMLAGFTGLGALALRKKKTTLA
jgi:hypothetical protein